MIYIPYLFDNLFKSKENNIILNGIYLHPFNNKKIKKIYGFLRAKHKCIQNEIDKFAYISSSIFIFFL